MKCSFCHTRMYILFDLFWKCPECGRIGIVQEKDRDKAEVPA